MKLLSRDPFLEAPLHACVPRKPPVSGHLLLEA